MPLQIVKKKKKKRCCAGSISRYLKVEASGFFATGDVRALEYSFAHRSSSDADTSDAHFILKLAFSSVMSGGRECSHERPKVLF
jgi:hypothetical protein